MNMEKLKEDDYDEEDTIGFEALYTSMGKCSKGVMWKGSAAHFVLNGLEQTIKLEEDLKKGTYVEGKTTTVRVTHPKPRICRAIKFRDRVYQRSLNDTQIYPSMTRGFIQTNFACQRGKGTDMARQWYKEALRRHYRKYGRKGGTLHVDVKGYYPSMRHDVAKGCFEKRLHPKVYKRAERILDGQYEGESGYDPGSQMVQIAGISVLDPIDHMIKEELRVKEYGRYMDDLKLIHPSMEYLEHCRKRITEELAKLGFQPNEKKTTIMPIAKESFFLGFYYRLTETGKVIMRVDPANVKAARRRLHRLVALAKKGEITKAKADECFRAWKDHASKGNSTKLIRRMDRYYRSLWAR